MIDTGHEKCARRTMRLEQDGGKGERGPDSVHEGKCWNGATLSACTHVPDADNNNLSN